MTEFDLQKWAAMILAAGKGTRMRSPLPKVLHDVAGKPMVARVIDAVGAAGISQFSLVLGGELQEFDSLLSDFPHAGVAIQKERRGTGDAVASGASALANFKLPNFAQGELVRGQPMKVDYLLVCTGDTPCLTGETLGEFIRNGFSSGCKLGVVGMLHPEPTGYGRLVLDSAGHLERIVEEKDADDATKKLNLCNSGIVYFEVSLLAKLLDQLNANNKSGEYYLTDCFEIAASQGETAYVYQTENFQQFDGVNTPDQLNAIVKRLTGAGSKE